MKSGDIKVTKKHLLAAILVICYMAMMGIVAQCYSKTIAILLLIPAVFFCLREFHKLPEESKRAISEKMKEQENSPIQKIITIIGYLLIAYIAYALLLSSIK